MNRLDDINARLAPLKAALQEHPLYQEIDRLDSLHVFMEHHVFAVWDFMSLLKVLQRRLCCVEVPWLPAKDSASCRLINEIVLAEESDADGRGGFSSHFELYRSAMQRSGAKTDVIDAFLATVRRGASIANALELAQVPASARPFVLHTFGIINGGNLCAIAAAFTFGREDLLPAVFQRIVDELDANPKAGLEEFKYYLHRHIGLDGDEHGPMAHQLLSALCGSDAKSWQIAEQTAVECLESRKRLWDGICEGIRRKKNK